MKLTLTAMLCVMLLCVPQSYCQDSGLDESDATETGLLDIVQEEEVDENIELDLDDGFDIDEEVEGELRAIDDEDDHEGLDRDGAEAEEERIIVRRRERERRHEHEQHRHEHEQHGVWDYEEHFFDGDEPDGHEELWHEAERQFERRQQVQMRHLEEMRERLDELERRIGAREDRKDEIVEQQVRRILEQKRRPSRPIAPIPPRPPAAVRRPLPRIDSPQTKLLMLELKQAELAHERAQAAWARILRLVEKSAASKHEALEKEFEARDAALNVEKARLKLEQGRTQQSEASVMQVLESHPEFVALNSQITELQQHLAKVATSLRPGSRKGKQLREELARLVSYRDKMREDLRPRALALPRPIRREGAVERVLLDELDPPGELR